MKLAFPLALGLAFGVAVAPACAQLSTSGMGGGMGGPGGAPPPQPKEHTPDLAPTGLPGVGGVAPLATGPKMQKSSGGDPTKELFTAINKNDYASAQDAISRGADLGAKDQFGETPLDLAIALNRNNITFLLLGTRNELAAQGGGGDTMGAPWTLNGASGTGGKGTGGKTPGQSRAVLPTKATAKPAPHATIPADDTGTPDPQAGFLGFGPKS
ncbi:ankyrin repeat domain-containing protein [Acidocella sp.]|uniref:ankyrin repeat domain-containing protein n=1 Tax=Acidocella sp. TaxID=50710 RepID=UPI003D013B69